MTTNRRTYIRTLRYTSWAVIALVLAVCVMVPQFNTFLIISSSN